MLNEDTKYLKVILCYIFYVYKILFFSSKVNENNIVLKNEI